MNYDYIGRLETLTEDLKELQPHIDAVNFTSDFPVSHPSMPKSGEYRHEKYAHMYRAMPYSVLKPVFDKYQADADMFGYSFDNYMPTEK